MTAPKTTAILTNFCELSGVSDSLSSSALSKDSKRDSVSDGGGANSFCAEVDTFDATVAMRDKILTRRLSSPPAARDAIAYSSKIASASSFKNAAYIRKNPRLYISGSL